MRLMPPSEGLWCAFSREGNSLLEPDDGPVAPPLVRPKLGRAPIAVVAVVVPVLWSTPVLPVLSAVHGQSLAPHVETELARLNELFRLLDGHADEVWPGWTDFAETEIRVQFPDMVQLIVGPVSAGPKGSEAVANRTVDGRPVLLNSTRAMPMDVRRPLIAGGAGGPVVTVRLQQYLPDGVPGRPFSLQDTLAMQGETQVLVFAHELFHAHQFKHQPGLQKPPPGGERLAHRPAASPSSLLERLMDFVPPPIHLTNLDYAVYKEIEAKALLRAVSAEEDSLALEHLREFSVARQLRYESMDPETVRREQITALMEGTALYVQLRLAELAAMDDRPGISPAADPHFFGYRYMEDYVEQLSVQEVQTRAVRTMDKDNVRYYMGQLQCRLLDRFSPGWKEGLLEGDQNLDDLTAALVDLTPREQERISEKSVYQYQVDELQGRHAGPIEARDEALEVVRARSGVKFILDFTLTQATPKTITPIGPVFQEEYIRVFPGGIERIDHGAIHLEGTPTPMFQPWAYWIEWVDTNANSVDDAYSLTFGSEEGDVYHEAILVTDGFTLRAPAISILERDDEVWVVLRSR